jgi:C-terminal processing protease CtpA/Prc
MNYSFYNQYFKYINSPKVFKLKYINSKNNKTIEASLTPNSKEKLDNTAKKLKPKVAQATDDLPYYQQFNKNYAILTIKTFDINGSDRENYNAFLDTFFQNIAEKKINNLILDLRGNLGGDPYCAAQIYSYLIKEKSPYFASDVNYYYDLVTPIAPEKNNFKGNLFTLIDGGCFSSTGHLCSLLKFHKLGTFIGEETGGSFVCTDNSQDITLYNTNLVLHFSTTKYSTAVSGLTPGRGILPNYSVTPTIQDYISNRDPVKIYAINLINKK